MLTCLVNALGNPCTDRQHSNVLTPQRARYINWYHTIQSDVLCLTAPYLYYHLFAVHDVYMTCGYYTCPLQIGTNSIVNISKPTSGELNHMMPRAHKAVVHDVFIHINVWISGKCWMLSALSLTVRADSHGCVFHAARWVPSRHVNTRLFRQYGILWRTMYLIVALRLSHAISKPVPQHPK